MRVAFVVLALAASVVPSAAQTLYASRPGVFGAATGTSSSEYVGGIADVGYRFGSHLDASVEAGVGWLQGLGVRVGYTSPLLVERWGVRGEVAALGWKRGRVHEDEFPYVGFDGELRAGVYNLIWADRPVRFIAQAGFVARDIHVGRSGLGSSYYAALAVVFASGISVEPSMTNDVVGLALRYNP